MLDIKLIRENPEIVQAAADSKHMQINLTELLRLDESLRKIKYEAGELRAEANTIAKQMSKANKNERTQLKEKGSELKSKVAELEEQERTLTEQFQQAMLTVPNLIPNDTPQGRDDSENVVVRTFGEPTKFDFKPKDHLEISELHDLLDFEAGAKVTGSKFYFMKNELALLSVALQQLAMNKAVARGYIPILTPDLARTEVLTGTGYQPRRGDPESEIYVLDGHDMCLVGTAEIPVGGYHAGEIIDEKKLPLKYVAFSHCFRTEAGAAGRASKGLYRVHQFSKVELFQFTTPEQGDGALEDIVSLEEEIFQALGLPYQVVRICAGDMGGPAYKKYDIEAWLPSKGENGEFGEVTSASNCTDFQARRLNIRYRKEGEKPEMLYTLNGTAVAMPRALIAILENYQQADGSVKIPEVLWPYMGGLKEIKADA